MNESRMCTKQSLRGSKRHRLTRWSEQQNIREDKTIGRLLHRCTLVSSGKISSCTAKNKNYDSDYSDNGQKSICVHQTANNQFDQNPSKYGY
jgi:hypothetical protein